MSNGVVIFSPQRPTTTTTTTSTTRPMVIQRHGIPEVRLYPPEPNDDQHHGHGHQQPSTDRDVNVNGSGSKWAAFISSTSTEEHQLQNWHPFHMRPANLASFPASVGSYRTSYRAQSVAIQRVRAGWVSSTAKSLDIVRQNLQSFINKELDGVIRRYVDKFFTPAIENIRRNNGEHAVSDEHVHMVCRQILDDAKRMYSVSYTRGSTPLGDCSDSETGSHSDGKLTSFGHRKSPSSRKRKDSDTDSEASQTLRPVKKKLGRPPLAFSAGVSGRITPSKQLKSHDPPKREGPKWDPTRLKEDTQFVMGARANKALGFGLTRGRLYMKHPEVFKYGGDSEDKQWLYDNNLMPATGGKAYLLVLKDIKDLAASDEYRNSPTVNVSGLVGFTVPVGMLAKIKASMGSMRTATASAPSKPRSKFVSTTVVSTLDAPQLDSAVEVAPAPLNEALMVGVDDIRRPPKTGSGIESSDPASPADDLDLLSGIADSCSPTAASPSPFTLTAGVEEDYVEEAEPPDPREPASTYSVMGPT